MAIPHFSLEGKVAIVTGGSRGIGRSIALGFAEAGADVVVASRTLAELEKVAQEIEGLGRRATVSFGWSLISLPRTSSAFCPYPASRRLRPLYLRHLHHLD